MKSQGAFQGLADCMLILASIPPGIGLATFRTALSKLRVWAREQGVYGLAMGYLGTVSMAILVANEAIRLQANRETIITADVLVQAVFARYSKRWPASHAIHLETRAVDAVDHHSAPGSDGGGGGGAMPVFTPTWPCKDIHRAASIGTAARVALALGRGADASSIDTLSLLDELGDEFLVISLSATSSAAGYESTSFTSSTAAELEDAVGWVRSRLARLEGVPLAMALHDLHISGIACKRVFVVGYRESGHDEGKHRRGGSVASRMAMISVEFSLTFPNFRVLSSVEKRSSETMAAVARSLDAARLLL
jgi:hypothetical protein